jgi:hypothetical protein
MHVTIDLQLDKKQTDVGFENIQETNSALYSLRRGLSNEVSLGIPFHLKKKVRGCCELPGQICKNHMRQNMGREKQKSTCFGIFYKNYLCPSYEFYSS